VWKRAFSGPAPESSSFVKDRLVVSFAQYPRASGSGFVIAGLKERESSAMHFRHRRQAALGDWVSLASSRVRRIFNRLSCLHVLC
jgi:hypothetical protein